MQSIPLSEGSFTIDKTKTFIPFDKQKDDLQQRPTGSLLVEIQPFAVLTKNDVILIDCGLGFASEQGILQIHQNLIDNNIDPLSVNKVLLSHLHKDHAGGISIHDPMLNRRFLSFPNATYYINRNEFTYAKENSSSSYVPELFMLLENSDQLSLIDDEGVIDGYIRHQVTSAHSKFHQVFWLEEDNEMIFFGGDDAPQLKQMKSRFVAKYDYDGKKSMELRTQWWDQGEKEHWTFLFYHDIQFPLMRR